jgi:hypothetical protein
MSETSSRKNRYEKPDVMEIAGLDAAEGFCISVGQTASGKTCTSGPDTTFPGQGSWCTPGGEATIFQPDPLCYATGTTAANCWVSGIGAGG